MRLLRFVASPDAAGALSPFEVRADTDVGYQAANTTSGSRLNSKLKDTPASISPFTPEFLSDISATNFEEMLAYATNVEVELEDSTNGFANPAGRQSIGGEYQFRVRGLVGSSSVNYVRSTVPVDLFNVERAELASGPNSILFGLGAPAADSVTSWFARGRPITDGPAVAGVITSLGTANRFTFYDQDNKV